MQAINDRLIETFRLEKAFRIIKSNCQVHSAAQNSQAFLSHCTAPNLDNGPSSGKEEQYPTVMA